MKRSLEEALLTQLKDGASYSEMIPGIEYKEVEIVTGSNSIGDTYRTRLYPDLSSMQISYKFN